MPAKRSTRKVIQADALTQSDIDDGTLDVVIGAAPLKPAELVVVDIAQFASDSEPPAPPKPIARKKKKS